MSFNDNTQLLAAIQNELDRRERIERATNSFEDFCNIYFGKTGRMQHKTPALHKELRELATNKNLPDWWYEDPVTGLRLPKKGLCVAAPRGHSKTTVLTFWLPLWWALTRRKEFIILIGSSAFAAAENVTDIREELESNELIKNDFGDLSGANFGFKWTQSDIIIVHNDPVTKRILHTCRIVAKSPGARIRGIRHRGIRPDAMICHQQGTPVLYNDTWIPVEKHPGVLGTKVTSGLEIKLRGLPQTEVVTEDHRYWAMTSRIRNYTRGKYCENLSNPGWIEAKNLTSNTYIGTPIDMTIEDPQPILRYRPGINNNSKRDAAGRIISGGSGGSYEAYMPDEFMDPDWWWIFGLWWGDGTVVDGGNISITVANRDDYITEEVKAILRKYDKPYSIIPSPQGDACHCISFCHRALGRWLHSWRTGNSRKQPPGWVERLPLEYQKELIRGYICADGWIDSRTNSVRLTSIHLEGLLCVRRILARLNVVSSIRWGASPRKQKFPQGHTCTSQQKYDLRFRDGAADVLGYTEIENQDRYTLRRPQFIKDGWLWTKVQDINKVENKTFVPITTDAKVYCTHFGLSHNCDDLENDEIVRNPESIQKIAAWLNGAAIPTMQPGINDFIVIGTILHFDSVLARLLSPKFKDIYVQRRYRAYWDNPDGSRSYLWPERFTPEFLEMERKRMGELQFNSEYLNNPVDPETRRFRPEWVRWYTREDISFKEGRWYYKDQPLQLLQAVDPAIKEKDQSRNDYFAHITVGVTEESKVTKRQIVILWPYHDHLDFPQQVQMVIKQFNTYPRTEKIAIETTAYQAALKQQVLVQEVLPIYQVKHDHGKTDKMARITAMSVFFENGQILLRAADDTEPGDLDELHMQRVHPQFRALYDSLMRYPLILHDDLLDVLEMCVSLAKRNKAFEEFRTDIPVEQNKKPYEKHVFGPYDNEQKPAQPPFLDENMVPLPGWTPKTEKVTGYDGW